MSSSSSSVSRPRAANRTYQRPTQQQWNKMSSMEKKLDEEKRKADQRIAAENKRRYDQNQANWRARQSQYRAPPAPRNPHFKKGTTFKPTQPPKNVNPFAGLDSDSDSDSDSEEDVPSLPSQKTRELRAETATIWTNFRDGKPTVPPKATQTVVVKNAPKMPTEWGVKKTTRWGDSDSEDEEPLNDAWDSD